MTTTLLRCVHCGHEQALYRQADGQHYYDLGGAAILCCHHCLGSAFRLVAEAETETEAEERPHVRPATVSYAYGSLGEYLPTSE